MALASRLAVIVGGVGGIGSVTGKLLRSQGAKLALLFAPHERERVDATLADISPDATKDIRAYECDITSPQSVDQAFASIAEDRIAFPSILVNAAGFVKLSPLENTPPEESLKHYMVNLFGPTIASQAFARMYVAAQQRVRQEDPNGAIPGGRIVSIASQAAHVALDQHGPYCASKAGLIGLTRCMASEWGPKGITANTISPGPVWTTMGKQAWVDKKRREDYQAAVPTGKFAEPEEVARIVAFLCQDDALNINGVDIRLDGGYCVR